MFNLNFTICRIAWKVSDRIDAKLACDTLGVAINKRKPKEPIIFHSDQGSQFKSASFRKILDEHQLLASYSKPGYPYDNAVTEAFFKYLKQREKFNSLALNTSNSFITTIILIPQTMV